MNYQTLLADVPIREANFPLTEEAPSAADRIIEDSRLLTGRKSAEGSLLFLALRGEHTDGHRFLPEVAGIEGSVVLAEEIPPGYPGKYILTGSTRKACAALWSRFYGSPADALTVTAVTGTNGKTTVTRMLRAICEEEGEKCGVIGTVGNSVGGAERETEVTTPSPRELYRLLAEMRQAGEKYVFMEASSHALAYEKLYPIKPRLGIFTNLTPEHLDFHKTMDAYAAAKAKLFESSEMALLNADSPFAGRMRAALPEGEGQCYLCSESSRNAHFMAQNIRESGDLGVEFDLIGENEAIHIRSDLPGSFTVMNCLEAAAGARLLGFSCEGIAMALRRFAGVRGRMERLALPGAGFRAYVDYAHTPDALQEALRSLRSCLTGEGKLTAVFGCGGNRDHEKRPLMGAVAAKYADRVILTEDNSRDEDPEEIIAQILSGMPEGKKGRCILPRGAAIRTAVEEMQPGDILLAAGKGHETYAIDKEGKHPAKGDHTLIREAYEEIYRKKP